MMIKIKHRLIRGYRELQGLTREALAEKAGVSAQDIAAWESGEAVPNLENLILLARALGFPVEVFLPGNEKTSFLFRFDGGNAEP